METKQKIATLENEIAQKQQTLNELRAFEETQEQNDIDINQTDIDEVINNILP